MAKKGYKRKISKQTPEKLKRKAELATLQSDKVKQGRRVERMRALDLDLSFVLTLTSVNCLIEKAGIK